MKKKHSGVRITLNNILEKYASLKKKLRHDNPNHFAYKKRKLNPFIFDVKNTTKKKKIITIGRKPRGERRAAP